MCLSNNNSLVAMKHSNSLPKPSRPYTEYNLFFQLEREHILQVQLGFEPDYEPHDIFDPSDAANYEGPPLPSRYSDLVYLNDWHLPGKEKRRKRRHRKTHGMISFQELSLKIADAWKTVDSETRVFCAELCEIGRMRYKVAMKSYKAMQLVEVETVPSQAKVHPENEGNGEKIAATSSPVQSLRALPVVAPRGLNFIPTDRCSMDEVDAAFENEKAFPLIFHDEAATEITPQTAVSAGSVFEESSVDSMVDIEDEVIIDMYTSAQPLPKSEGLNISTAAFPNDSFGTNTFSSAPYHQNESSYSNIKDTMSELKNMSKILLNQQIQIQSSIIANMQATMVGKHISESMKHDFTAV